MRHCLKEIVFIVNPVLKHNFPAILFFWGKSNLPYVGLSLCYISFYIIFLVPKLALVDHDYNWNTAHYTKNVARR